MESVRNVVADVLCGINVRNATETLTRRRLALLNAALFVTYLRGDQQFEHFCEDLVDRAHHDYFNTRVEPSERRILQWMLGLTSKSIQNVLRSDEGAWSAYLSAYKQTLADAAEAATKEYGALTGDLRVGSSDEANMSWLWALYLLAAVGTQTLAIRGSEKSMYGKLFEKLVLAAALHIMGLELTNPTHPRPGVYWLSSRGDKRESDATALFNSGVGVRFDIGFIGPGNTEISLDKVSRFRKEVEMGRRTWHMRTFIIVDRIGARSTIVNLAKDIDGIIVQMSASYWPRELAAELRKVVPGFRSRLIGSDDAAAESLIRQQVQSAPFEKMFEIAVQTEPEAAEAPVDEE